MYSPKIMLDKNLFTIYHQDGRGLISLKDVFLSFKFPTLRFNEFMIEYVFPNFKVDEEYVNIDEACSMFGMEKIYVSKLVDLIDCSETFQFKKPKK